MESFESFIVKENHDSYKKIAPYIVIVSAIMLAMSFAIRDDRIIQIYHFGLLLISVLFWWGANNLKASKCLFHSFILLLILWGILRMFVFPDRVMSHTPLISILFCSSYFFIYSRGDAIKIYMFAMLAISAGLLYKTDLQFLIFFISYLNIIFLCIVFTYTNYNTRKQIYENTQRLKDQEAILNDNINHKENENFLLVSQVQNTIEYGQMILNNHYKSDRHFLKSVFSSFTDLCIWVDKSFIAILNEKSVDIVGIKGFAEEEIEEMQLVKAFESITIDKIAVVDDLMDGFNKSLIITVSADGSGCVGIVLEYDSERLLLDQEHFINLAQSFKTLIKTYYLNREYTDLQSRYMKDIIFSLVEFMEIYDPYTKGHSEKVANYSKEIAESLKLDKKTVKSIYWAGLLHDIGKLIVPREILNKKGKLTDLEYDQIKDHPVTAYRIMKSSYALKDIARFILSHHERWDGKGYPNRLAGDEIPLESRILSVADAFEAMTSERSYRAPMTEQKAIDELIKHSGDQFDPDIVKVFLKRYE